MWHTWQIAATVAGSLIAVGAGLFYIWTILKGDTRPNRISWFGWSLASVLGVWVAFDQGAGLGAVVAAIGAGGEIIIFGLSLIPKYGKPGAEQSFDYVVAAISTAGILVWTFAPLSPTLAVSVAIAADLWFVWLILRETWRQPDTEPIGPWLMSFTSVALGATALQSFNYAAAAFPVYIFLANAAILGTLVVRKSRTKSA